MASLINILIPVGILILLDQALGQQQSIFMEKYKEAIQKYIMTGHEKGWQHCDILSANPSAETVPHISMTLEKTKTFNIKSAFENTQCLLVNYDVNSKASLSTLLEFGRKAINHVRLALVVKMGARITEEMATNTSNLPFLVAAEFEDGTKQFICPTVGESKPHLSHKMCSPSYLDYKNKSLRIGLMGIPPDFALTSEGTIDGANMRLIKMMANKMKFMPEIKLATSMNAAENQVYQLN